MLLAPTASLQWVASAATPAMASPTKWLTHLAWGTHTTSWAAPGHLSTGLISFLDTGGERELVTNTKIVYYVLACYVQLYRHGRESHSSLWDMGPPDAAAGNERLTPTVPVGAQIPNFPKLPTVSGNMTANSKDVTPHSNQ